MKKATHPLLGSIAALCLSAAATSAQDHTWIAPVTGVWSNSANWLGGEPPPVGGGSALGLKFAPITATVGDINSTNDLAGNFLVNALEFEVPIASRLSLVTPPPNALVFSGTNSRITQSGPGSIVLSGTFDASDGITTLNGAGSGDITFDSLEGLSVGNTLRIAVGLDSGNGQVVYAKSDATGGTVQLDSGNLSLKSSPNNGNTNLRINGGTVRVESGSVINSGIELGASLVMLDPNNATITSAIAAVTPTAGLELRTNGGGLNLTGASTYTGRTLVDVGITATSYTTAVGTLHLSGNGSLLKTSEFDIRATGTLEIHTAVATKDRVGDSTPIILRGGRLLVVAPTTSVGLQSERVGPLSVSGFGSVTLGSIGQSMELTAASLSRLQRGTVLFRSPTLTGLNTTPARILFTTAPALVGGGGTGPDTSILPYAIGDTSTTGNGVGLVTYDPVKGVRLLNTTTEYVSSLASATPTSNVRLIGAFPSITTDHRSDRSNHRRLARHQRLQCHPQRRATWRR